MKITKYETREDWLEARKGKITGSRFKDILVKRGSGRKLGFYELIAEKIGLPADDESPMDRGTRLEEEALERYQKEKGVKVNTDLVMWQREDNENIAISPDGYKGKKLAVECKCLASARHLEAYLTKQIPKDYEEQKLQYFIVNDDLQQLDFVFYDPRIPSVDFFVITVKREEVQEQVDKYLQYQKEVFEEIDRIVSELTF